MGDFQGISHTVQYILGSQAGKVQVMCLDGLWTPLLIVIYLVKISSMATPCLWLFREFMVQVINDEWTEVGGHIKCSTRVKGQDVNMISIMAPEAKSQL